MNNNILGIWILVVSIALVYICWQIACIRDKQTDIARRIENISEYITTCIEVKINEKVKRVVDKILTPQNQLNTQCKEPEIDWTKVPKGTRVWTRNDSTTNEWEPGLFLKVTNSSYPYRTTLCDIWVAENAYRNYEGQAWKYCKLDDSVVPTPYYKDK